MISFCLFHFSWYRLVMIHSVQAKQDAKGFDVFISYSTRNKHTADAMKQYLQAKGIRCWKAPDDIIHGESWAKAIPIAIRMARIMVLIWTKDSMSSGQVVNELTLASRANKLVIPFRTESIEPEDEFEYYLAKTHWLDAFGDNLNDHFDLLFRRIEVNLLSEVSADECSLRQGGATDVGQDLNQVSQEQQGDVLDASIVDTCLGLLAEAKTNSPHHELRETRPTASANESGVDHSFATSQIELSRNQ